MKYHLFRPLYVISAVVALVFLAQYALVSPDFGTGPRGYMYSWHRLGNEREWKERPIRYRGPKYCASCHQEKVSSLHQSPHAAVSCENCHGPAGEHPDAPPKLPLDRNPNLCLRCHFRLPYGTSLRGRLKGIRPDEHNPGEECATCHDPHQPTL